MWFSPWRRVLRGRSGDAKPSGLRAGTKFVEEDTGVEYTYDPVMKDWKKKVAPYSAIVCKDGSTVWAEDASGKTIASGESGVDDAGVIQSAIDFAPEYSTIYLSGNFQINNKITISKNGLHFIGNNCFITIATELGFEIFNGNDQDPYPELVRFERVRFEGNYNDIIYFKYSANWALINCEFYKAKHAILLERTWGRRQLILGCRIVGSPPDGEGLITAPTPTNNNTNEFTVFNSAFRLENPNAAVFHFPLQANNGFVNGIEIISCHHEGDGKFITGYLRESEIIGGAIKGEQGSLWLTEGDRLTIKPREASHMYFGKLVHSKIRVQWWYGWSNDIPLLQIDQPAMVDIVPTGMGYHTLNNAPLIKVGSSEWSYDVKIHDADIRGATAPAIIEIGSSGEGYEIYNVGFLGLNPDNTLTECYAIKTNGIPCILKQVRFSGTNYTPVNNISKVHAIGIRIGVAKFENSGTATFSGDGTTTDFEIGAHGLVITDPSKIVVKVTPVSSDAIAASPCVGYVDPADNTKIRVKFSSAPASGSENVKIVWYAEVIS